MMKSSSSGAATAVLSRPSHHWGPKTHQHQQQQHDLPLSQSKKRDGDPVASPRRLTSDTTPIRAIPQQGLVRRSRSFDHRVHAPPPNNLQANNKTPLRTCFSISPALRRVPRRHKSTPKASQIAAHLHQKQLQYVDLEEEQADKKDEERKISTSFLNRKPSPVQRIALPATTAHKTPKKIPILPISNLCCSGHEHAQQHKPNTTSGQQRLYRLLYVCMALGMVGLWVSMGLFHRNNDHHSQPYFHSSDQIYNGTPPPPQGLRNVQTQIRSKLTQLLLDHQITTPDRLQDPTSPAHEALNWLVDSSQHQWTLQDAQVWTRFALATLFFATHSTGSVWAQGEHQWVPHTAEPPRICDWYGITCSSPGDDDEMVTQVQLSQNQLQGTLPQELFAGLTHLQLLDVSHNSLWGSIPANWETASHLQTLYLHHNALTGTIPEKLRTLKSILQSTPLKHVQLSHNDFVAHHFEDNYDNEPDI